MAERLPEQEEIGGEPAFVADLEEYKYQRALRRIAQIAIEHMGEEGGQLLSFLPELVDKSSRGTVTVKFHEYENGFLNDELGIVHSAGKSGHNETWRVYDITYDAASKTTFAGYLHRTHFLRHIKDIEAKRSRHRDEFENELQNVRDAIAKAEENKKESDKTNQPPDHSADRADG